MAIAKLFAGPQDGLSMPVKEAKLTISVIRSVDPEGDPQDLYCDIYVYVPDWCANPRCQFLHYEFMATERTTDQGDT